MLGGVPGDDGADEVAATVVGDAEDDGVFDFGELEEGVFDFGGVDVDAVADEHIALSSDEVEEAVFVEVAAIAHRSPPLFYAKTCAWLWF